MAITITNRKVDVVILTPETTYSVSVRAALPVRLGKLSRRKPWMMHGQHHSVFHHHADVIVLRIIILREIFGN